jgi:hypothetical protein
MAFVVVYDASVLYGNTLRDLLIRIAQTGMVQANHFPRRDALSVRVVRRASPSAHVGHFGEKACVVASRAAAM